MKYTILIFLLVSINIACTKQGGQAASGFDYQQYFDNIAKVDNCLKEGEVFDVLGQRLDAVIKAPVNAIKSAPTLKQLYHETHQRQAKAPPRTNGRCADTYVATKGRILQKLATMNSEEAATALIDLYKDTSLPFEGGEGKSMRRALTVFGKSILPKLEPIKDQRPQIGPLVVQELQQQ